MKALAAAGAIALLAAPSASPAHDLWIEREGQAFVLRYGHRGGEALPLDAGRVTSILCREADQAPRQLRGQATVEPREIRVAAGCDAIAVRLDGGFWSLTPDGEVNFPPSQVAQAVRSWRSLQFTKWVDPRSPASGAPLGEELEIVLVGDASRRRVGDKVTVRVLSSGKPVAGAVVSVGHRPLGETDGAGETRVRIRSEPLESIGATVKRPLGTAEAQVVVLEASLTFEVAR